MGDTHADPDVLDQTAGPVRAVASLVRSIPGGVRPQMNGAAGACGDPGLEAAIRGFDGRCGPVLDGLGQTVDALAHALNEVATAFRKAGG
jgi:hypothetical protein